MIYLAEKAGSPLWPSDIRARTQVMEWLFFQVGGVGPQFGQALHFYKYADQKIQYGIDRYMKEAHRLLKVMNDWLADKRFFAGDYSLADIAIYPWIARHEWLDIDWTPYPHLRRWFDALSERPTVQKGLTVLAVGD
jgi:glutathione S-transferase